MIYLFHAVSVILLFRGCLKLHDTVPPSPSSGWSREVQDATEAQYLFQKEKDRRPAERARPRGAWLCWFLVVRLVAEEVVVVFPPTFGSLGLGFLMVFANSALGLGAVGDATSDYTEGCGRF